MSLEENGWIIKDGEIKPLWFVGSQFPPSTKRRKGREIPKQQDQDDADVESETEPPQKSHQVRKKDNTFVRH